MPDLFTYCEVELKDFIAEALITKDTLLKRVIYCYRVACKRPTGYGYHH